MKCKICGKPAVKIFTRIYNVFQCKSCNTHFIHPTVIKEDYNQLYSDHPNYTFHQDYTTGLIKSKGPLQYLSKSYVKYYPVLWFIKKYKIKNILELGCGYGFLTYALSKQGHDVTGVDGSLTAIKYAKKHFSKGKFVQDDIYNFLNKSKRKYDLIISIAVIEHLTDPINFVKKCKSRLNKKGKLLLLTPNKDFFSKNKLWGSDPPPRHWFWLGKKSMQILADRSKMKIEYINMNNSTLKENNLLEFIRKNNQQPNFDQIKKDFKSKKIKRSKYRKLIHSLLLSFPIRDLSNLVHPKNKKLAVLLY